MTRWPLAAVLWLSERAEEEAAAAFARAAAERDRRRAEEERARLDLEGQRRLLAAVPARAAGGVPRAGTLLAAARHAARLREEEASLGRALRARGAARVASEAELARRREALAAARAAVRALEERRARWVAARVRARDRRMQDAAEDLVSARPRSGW